MRFVINRIQQLLSAIISREIRIGMGKYVSDCEKLNAAFQKQLLMQMKATTVAINDLGFSVFSESDEDGLLLYIFSKIGFRSKVCVDIGGGFGLEGSNTANLIINHGFIGLIIEENKNNAELLRQEYCTNKATKHNPPLIVEQHVTPENINSMIEEHGVKGDIDLLSIDIDSVDYWVWEILKAVTPRVVIVETQCILGDDEAKTVPLNFTGPVFETVENKRYGIYNGASLKAFSQLALKKGYSLVATSSMGFNAIFVKKDLMDDLPLITVEQGSDKPFVRWARNAFGSKIKKLDWEEV